MQRQLLIIMALVAFAGGITFGILHRQPPLALASGTLLTPPRAVIDFELIDDAGATLTRADLSGQWTLVFFGFTRCPDVCPTTLQMLARMRADLAADLDADALPQVLLVSVDPARDTPAALAAYTAYFGDFVSGATAAEPALFEFARDLGVVYQRVELPQQDDYTMDHTAAIIVLDPQVQLRAVFTPPLKPRALRADLAAMIGASR